MPYAAMIGGLAVMGFGPHDVRRWSFWEYNAVVSAWNDAHQTEPEKPAPPPIEALHEARRLAQERGWDA